MKRDLILIALVILVTGIVTYSCFPKVIEKPSIPTIITKTDTVSKLPSWYEDSIKYWKKRKHTTDTVNLVIERTVTDTQTVLVSIPCAAAERSKIQPVLSYFGGTRFGDTAIVTTLRLTDGGGTISKVFIPGVLTALVADSVTGTPKMTFVPFPTMKKSASFFQKLTWAGVGFASCSVVNMVR